MPMFHILRDGDAFARQQFLRLLAPNLVVTLARYPGQDLTASMMLMPKIENQDQNQDGNRANNGFGGAVTTVAQGNPVPVLRGCREIGGFVVSAGQYPEDQM